MKTEWRLLDTGVRAAAQNMALDQALASVRGRGLSPNTVRFLQFSPPAALVGAFQVVEQEIRREFCNERSFDINRRITGGGALLFDEAQLGWELIAGLKDFDVHPMSQAFHRRICEACIAGLKTLGIEAAFRPRNDIEVNGRKISGTGGFEEGEAFLFQGTLLLDFDVESMIKALRVPTEKLKQSSLDSAADRVTWVAKELGHLPPIDEIKSAIAAGFEDVFGVDLLPSSLLPKEQEEYEKLLPHFESDEWVYGERPHSSEVGVLSGLHSGDSAAIRAHVSADLNRKTLRSALLTGDLFISPKRAIYDLEARLKDARFDLDEISKIVWEYWRTAQPRTSGFGPEEIVSAIGAATRKLELLDFGFEMREIEKMFTVNGSPGEILGKKIDLALLPYCAKMQHCAYRHDEDCIVCGMCKFGDTFEAAQSAGMRPITITSFEHLMETLERERESGCEAYIGSCCEAFYEKHYADFEAAELPGILVDLSHSTCYDLNKQRDAYQGVFDGYTEMDTGLMVKLIKAAGRAWVDARRRAKDD
jgi:lipoate-protein ligase A